MVRLFERQEREDRTHASEWFVNHVRLLLGQAALQNRIVR